jgi:uncharacterized membrane-anchored protein
MVENVEVNMENMINYNSYSITEESLLFIAYFTCHFIHDHDTIDHNS